MENNLERFNSFSKPPLLVTILVAINLIRRSGVSSIPKDQVQAHMSVDAACVDGRSTRLESPGIADDRHAISIPTRISGQGASKDLFPGSSAVFANTQPVSFFFPPKDSAREVPIVEGEFRLVELQKLYQITLLLAGSCQDGASVLAYVVEWPGFQSGHHAGQAPGCQTRFG